MTRHDYHPTADEIDDLGQMDAEAEALEAQRREWEDDRDQAEYEASIPQLWEA